MQEIYQSPTDPDFVQNPYPFYAHMRAAGDMAYWTDYDMPAAFSHRAVRMLLSDKRLGRAVPDGQLTGRYDHLPHWKMLEDNSMLELEAPRHTRLRSLVMRAFTSRKIVGMDHDIAQISDDLIQAFPRDGAFDILDAFARPLPVTVIARLLGVPETDGDQMLRWSNDMVAMYQSNKTPDTETKAEAASRDFTLYLQDFITQKRKAPKDDLISDLIAATQDGLKLNSDELVATVVLLMNAGHEATVHTLGNAIKLLCDHSVKDITEPAVEEILRYDPPLHIFTRWAYEDIDCFGHHIPAGREVACVLASANRDDAVFADAHVFDPTRKPGQIQSFGAGIHFCVGAPLARKEILIGLQHLFKHVPNLRLTTPPRYANAYHFHGLEQVMVQT